MVINNARLCKTYGTCTYYAEGIYKDCCYKCGEIKPFQRVYATDVAAHILNCDECASNAEIVKLNDIIEETWAYSVDDSMVKHFTEQANISFANIVNRIHGL